MIRRKGLVRTSVPALLAAFALFAGLFPLRAETVSASADLRFSEVILEIGTPSSLEFRIPSSSLSGYTSLIAVFELDGEQTTISNHAEFGGYTYFVLSDIPADKLNKPISARLTAVSGGVVYTGDEMQRSPIECSLSAFDVNEDKDVTVLDLIRLKKYLAGNGSVYISSVADPKNDGDMDAQDMAALQRYLLIAPAFSSINRIPPYPNDAAAEISETGKQNTLGAYTETASRISGAAARSSVDLTATDQIEFDIYVEDHNAFAAAVMDKGFRFFVSSGNTQTDNRADYDIIGKIEKNGWNHIVLTKSSPTENGGANFADIRWFGLVFRNGSGSNPAAGTQVRIVNICGTKKTGGNWTEDDDDF